RAKLHSFLKALRGGRSLVLLGSRSGEEWLAAGTFEANLHDLGGLDPEAASTLAERILKQHGASQHLRDPDLGSLLRLLAGFPLALKVVLPNLARQTPEEVLVALEAGDVKVDPKQAGGDRTQSILRCIDYSHSNLSAEAQGLLSCLAPFTGVLNTE